MILTLDIGNTAIKGGVFDGPEAASVFHLEVGETGGGSDAADGWERALRKAVNGTEIKRAGLVSVVPDATPAAEQALAALTGRPVTTVTHDMPLPFRLAYETPHTLGADRLAAAAAAWSRFGRGGGGGTGEAGTPRSVIAVDAGTAVTYEVVHRDGSYRGGAIGAAPVLMQRALRSGTAQLPTVPLTFPDGPVGRSTRSALQSGILWGFVDGVAGMIDRLASTLPDDPAVVVTGGWSDVLAEHVDAIDHVVPHLVLDGVRLLMEGTAEPQAGAA